LLNSCCIDTAFLQFLDSDVVKSQVDVFKATEAALLKKLEAGVPKKPTKDEVDESAVAKLSEEMKSLPSRVAERLAEVGDPYRRRRIRRFHPMMFDEMMHMSGDPSDPVGILMAASMVREDVPWLYELAVEAYKAAKDGDAESIEKELRRIRRFSEFALRGPFAEELGMGSKETHMFIMEFPRMLERSLMRALEERAVPAARRQKSETSSNNNRERSSK
jgi:hypothetical protein